MDSSKKASSSGGTPNKSKGKGSQQQTPSKQSSTSRPKSDKTASKEDTKTTRTQSPTPRSIFTPANNVNPFTSTVTSAVSTPESQKAHLSSDDDDSPVRRPVDPEAFEEISASEAEGMPGSRKTSAELVREYSHVYQPAVQGPGDEAEFDGDEED
ncbi:hypothetical protein KC315_g7664 [Hortaea werneckii]|nr:hypothetical protein KC315_g7664 [Hortaea werneckii]